MRSQIPPFHHGNDRFTSTTSVKVGILLTCLLSNLFTLTTSLSDLNGSQPLRHGNGIGPASETPTPHQSQPYDTQVTPANGTPSSPQKRQREEQEQEHEEGRPVKRHNGEPLNGLGSMYPDAHSDDDAEGSVDGEVDEYAGVASIQRPAGTSEMGLGGSAVGSSAKDEFKSPGTKDDFKPRLVSFREARV